MTTPFPPLPLASWQETRDTVHHLARVLGKIRAAHTPRAKHWWHITLGVTARGLSTGPIPATTGVVELSLDLTRHEIAVSSGAGWGASRSIVGARAADLERWLMATLATADLAIDLATLPAAPNDGPLPYDAAAAAQYRQALGMVDAAFREFKGGLREETSPVQLFPHHMDLAMNWFSGRLVPGADPADEERADEQLNFGFVTGDGAIPDAYFYGTAYPAPDGWTALDLTPPAYWQMEGWSGAVLPYVAVATADDGPGLLLDFLRTVQAHGAGRMS